jgi:L-methionine (R)-S-oxide reductase
MSKKEVYKKVLSSIHALIDDEEDIIAVMSTVAFVVYDRFPYMNWVGFYRMVDEKALKVGPYHGTVGCLTIDISRGVCGKCVRDKAMQLHNDISKVEDHIACDSNTKAEIVFPIIDQNGNVKAVFDIDSLETDCFDETDVKALQKIADLISSKYK